MDSADDGKNRGAAPGKMQVGLSAQKQAAPENADATLHSGLEWISSGRALDDFILIASVIGFLMFAYSFILYPTQIFPDNWFPSSLAAWGFKIIFSAWVLTEIVNSAWSRKNSIYFFDERKSLAKSADFAKAKSQDKGSYWVVVCATWIAVFATFLFRGMGIGTFDDYFQYAGLAIAAAGIILRQWSISALGRHFTVRVQVGEKATLVTQGPYKYARHPSYAGSLLTFVGLPIAIGTWPGALLVFAVCMIGYHYRIEVEEEALVKAFGAQYEEYKKRTCKMFPGF